MQRLRVGNMKALDIIQWQTVSSRLTDIIMRGNVILSLSIGKLLLDARFWAYQLRLILYSWTANCNLIAVSANVLVSSSDNEPIISFEKFFSIDGFLIIKRRHSDEPIKRDIIESMWLSLVFTTDFLLLTKRLHHNKRSLSWESMISWGWFYRASFASR